MWAHRRVCVCVSIENKSDQKRKKRWIFEAEKASSISYCAFIYLFFSVFNAFDLWLKCLFFSLLLIWYRCSREILFAALVHCGIVFYVCNVHVTMTMWILDSILLLFLLVIDAVANDTLQNTCEHGNNHAFNFKFAHMHACMHPLAWYGQIKYWLCDASKGNSTCSLPCNTFPAQQIQMAMHLNIWCCQFAAMSSCMKHE